ncbi:hypothetical protein GCM10009660_29520 [Catellatospora bangladeshensis]
MGRQVAKVKVTHRGAVVTATPSPPDGAGVRLLPGGVRYYRVVGPGAVGRGVVERWVMASATSSIARRMRLP